MKLGEYLKKKKITPQDFAPLIGVAVAAVYRYMGGIRTPKKDVMIRIYEVTEGAVTPNDILGIPTEKKRGK